MRSTGQMDSSQLLQKTDRLAEFSIVVEDFDSSKTYKSQECAFPEVPSYERPQRPYVRKSSEADIKKILEEAENRKHEFWKLIDEHSAVIENLKKIEQLEHGLQYKKANDTAIIT